MKKLFGKLTALTLAALLAMALFTGCGGETVAEKSDEDLIIEDLQDDLDIINNCTDQMKAEFESDEDLVSIFEMAGVDPGEYAEAYASTIKGEVSSVTVDGDTAVAVLSLTMPDFEQMDAFQDQFLEEYTADMDLESMSEDDLYKVIGEALMACIKDPNLPLKTDNFDVNYTKVDGVWTADNEEDVAGLIEQSFGVTE